MRIRLRGINSYTAKLADGTSKTYWYAWKGGPRLIGEPGTPEFIASYNEALPRADCFRFSKAIKQAMTSVSSRNAPRDDYAGIIEHVIEPGFSDFPVSGLGGKRTRGVFFGMAR